MSKLDDFIKYLNQEVENHSIYTWGAQGQRYPTITEKWIRSREDSKTNADRAIKYWKKQCSAGFEKVLGAFDCSGLGVYWLLKEKMITSDTTANGLKGKCAKLSKSDLKRGDWVFRVDGSKAYHIGYIVDDKLNVIEAKGRDDGVVKRPLTASGSDYWNYYGRPSVFKKDIEAKPAPAPITTEVYTVKKGDTLGKIADMYNCTVGTLVDINDINDPNKIFVGQEIKIPSNGAILHVVVKGDNLSKIADKYGTTVKKICALNDVDDPNKIYVGQIIKVM